jgi:signal transduction histidine kinase
VTTPLRVLVVEDSEDDTTLLLRELRRGGYEVSFERVDSVSSMKAAVAEKQWDIVMCDYSMPHFSGMDALKILRAKASDVPFIFLSGTIGEEMAVGALKEGAQNCLMKNNMSCLLPAIQRELCDAELRKQRQQLEQQVQRLQKFEAIGRLAGCIAHDFNNALAVILGWSQLGCDEAPAGSPAQRKFLKISEQAQHSAGLTRQMLAFARRQVLQPKNLDLNDLVIQTKRLLESVVGEQIEFALDLAQDLPVIRADPSQIEQVLMNLCLNARDAMPKGGRLLLATSNLEMTEEFCRSHSFGSPGQFVSLSVSDTGVGMDAETLNHMFEPFFTTKQGKGAGLGLASVYGIVKQHRGFVNVYSEPKLGTTFRIHFPSGTGGAEPLPVVIDRHLQRGTETILVADDREELRELFSMVLGGCGYRIIQAKDGREAVGLFRAHAKEIRLVVLDVVMPVLNGPEAYSQMRGFRPDLPVVFTSGHTAELASLSSLIEEGACFLQKPYDPGTLRDLVRTTLDRSAPRSVMKRGA